LLEASRPVLALAASVLGAPYLSSLIGGATGLTGSALAGATGATIAGGSTALTGGSAEDTLRAALLGGGGGYLGSELNNYIASMDVPVDFVNMTPEQIADATETNLINDLKRAGLSNAQIDDFITNAGGSAVTTPIVASTPDANAVTITAPSSLNNVLNAISAPVAVSTPVTDTVKVEAARTPEAVDQATLNLINSQIASNVGTPTNLASVQVTGDRPVTTQEIANVVAATIPANTSTTTPLATQTITAPKAVTTQEIVNAITASLPTVSAVTTPIANQTITGQKPATVQEIVNAITATIPTVTPAQAQTIAQQVITSNKPVTTQEVINAISATLPTNLPTTTITAPKQTAVGDALALLPSTLVSTPATTTPTKETDPLRVAQLALATAGLLGAGSVLSSGGATQFPIVPVPETFLTPTKPAVAPFTPLTPINFGDGNLLRGTQWEKFLDPNYGKVPEPIKYSQPSSLSYNDLMGILGSKQGMPPSSSLSINDIISGIQNQYGQVPARSMG